MAKTDDVKKSEAELAHEQDERFMKMLQSSNQATIEAIMPALVAALKAGQTPGQAVSNVVKFSKEKCPDCGQYKVACGSKHTMMLVWPQRYPELAGAFDGVRINGVQYVSVDNRYKVCVPEASVSSIVKMIQDYEQNERENIIGRKQKSWNSGTISPNGQNQINQPNMAEGWR